MPLCSPFLIATKLIKDLKFFTLLLKSLEINSSSHTVNLGTGIGYSVLDLINSYSKVSKKDL